MNATINPFNLSQSETMRHNETKRQVKNNPKDRHSFGLASGKPESVLKYSTLFDDFRSHMPYVVNIDCGIYTQLQIIPPFVFTTERGHFLFFQNPVTEGPQDIPRVIDIDIIIDHDRAIDALNFQKIIHHLIDPCILDSLFYTHDSKPSQSVFRNG